jgi:hypothetical protein
MKNVNTLTNNSVLKMTKQIHRPNKAYQFCKVLKAGRFSHPTVTLIIADFIAISAASSANVFMFPHSL